MQLRLILLFLCLLINISLQRSSPEDEHYVAAAVEFQFSSNSVLNLQQYIQIIKEAKVMGADIVVFPEATLTNGTIRVAVPMYQELKACPVPAQCPELFHEFLVALSAAARAHEIYVLVNLDEQLDCTKGDPGEDCPEGKIYQFSTNVVFDRIGAIIDRYRKIHTFLEPQIIPSLDRRLGVFSTDFGVTFGHLICFDILFQTPTVRLVQQHKIKDVLFPTMWFSELPFITAVQAQQAVAYEMNINLIAAGGNYVAIGSAGSGIYSGKAGALVGIFPGVPTTRLLVARVPKEPGRVTEEYPGFLQENPMETNTLLITVDSSLPVQVSRLLELGFQEFALHHNNVACKFRVRLTRRKGTSAVVPYFMAFAKDGISTYSYTEMGVVSCVIVACETKDASTCGYRYTSDVTTIEVQELEIEMKAYRKQYNWTIDSNNIIYYPTSFTTKKIPLSPREFTYMESNGLKQTTRQASFCPQNYYCLKDNAVSNDSREHLVVKLNEPHNNLVSFGIWGRVFTRDYVQELPEGAIDVMDDLVNNVEDLMRERIKWTMQ